MVLKHITKALKGGCSLHAFLSGGGLRVIRVEKGKKLKGYGEHPNVQEALVLTNKTLRPLGRIPTKSVYLTGSSSAADPLDEWLLRGDAFDAWADGDKIVVQLLSRSHSNAGSTAKTGRGESLDEAVQSALEAPQLEVKQKVVA